MKIQELVEKARLSEGNPVAFLKSIEKDVTQLTPREWIAFGWFFEAERAQCLLKIEKHPSIQIQGANDLWRFCERHLHLAAMAKEARDFAAYCWARYHVALIYGVLGCEENRRLLIADLWSDFFVGQPTLDEDLIYVRSLVEQVRA